MPVVEQAHGRDAVFPSAEAGFGRRDALLLPANTTLLEQKFGTAMFKEDPISMDNYLDAVKFDVANNSPIYSAIGVAGGAAMAAGAAAAGVALSPLLIGAAAVATGASLLYGLPAVKTAIQTGGSNKDFWDTYESNIADLQKDDNGFSRGLGQAVTYQSLPQGWMKGSMSEAVGQMAGTLIRDFAVAGVLGPTGSLAAKTGINLTLAMGVNGAVDTYNKHRGLGDDEDAAMRHAIAHGVGSGVSGLLAFNLLPYVATKLFNKTTYGMIGTGVKTGMEVSGWDVGTQLLEDVTLTAMEGKDVSFKSSFDKIDPSIAASLFAGSFLLGFGGKAGGELIKGVFGKAKGKITEKIFEAVNTKGVVADNARAANVKLKADDLLDDFIKSQNKNYKAEDLTNEQMGIAIRDLKYKIDVERQLPEEAINSFIRDFKKIHGINIATEDNIIRFSNEVVR